MVVLPSFPGHGAVVPNLASYSSPSAVVMILNSYPGPGAVVLNLDSGLISDIINVSTITTSKCVIFFVDWLKFGAPNLWCFVIIFFVSFLHSFCAKIQANEGER